MGKHTWKKANISGDRWKDEDDVMLLIYTPTFIVSLESKSKEPKLRAIHPRYHSVSYFHSVK